MSHSNPHGTMETTADVYVEPVIVHTKGALVRAIEQGVARGISTARSEWERERQAAPGFGWITNEKAMELLGLSRPTLARYRASGKLPYSRVGSSVYYRLEDVEALLESGMTHDGADQ